MSSLPLHYKILLWFVLFSLIMLVLLWVFQTVCFRSVYSKVRVNQVKKCASSIEENINSNNITTLVENLAEQNDVMIYVYDTTDSTVRPVYSTDKSFMKIMIYDSSSSSSNDSNSGSSSKSSGSSDKNSSDKKSSDNSSSNKNSDSDESDSNSSITHRQYVSFSTNQLIKGESPYNYYSQAKASDDKTYTRYIDEEENSEDNLLHKIKGLTPPMDKLNTKGVVYTSLFDDDSNNNYMLIITSQSSPVDSVVNTLRYQLVTVTFILLFIGVFIAIVAARKISKPITDTTKSALKLANKDYDVQFNSTGYLEVTELNNTLNYAATELKKVDSLQRELIANISHDLRTPLTMITGYGEVMRDLPGENTPENIQIIIDEANRLNMLVTDLLDISKLQSGATEINREVFSITTLIKEMFQRYNKLKEQEGYTLDFEYDEDIYVNADYSKISQVIYNLVNNAINYSRTDKHIIVRQSRKDKNVLIEVIDHGEGIDQEHLENIWDRYYKVDKEHKSSVVGTGLGLSIVKNVLDRHNAHYGVKSVVGEGSNFWFELEIANSPE